MNYSTLAMNYGAGIKLLLSEHLMGRLEYRAQEVGGDHTIEEAYCDPLSRTVREL